MIGRHSRSALAALTASLATLTVLLALPGAAPAAGCPNEALRIEQGATSLPGCMALEMASPQKKFGQTAFLPSFSADGQRVLFTAQAALADTPGFQQFPGDRYIAGRTPSGWDTAPTSAPASAEIVSGGSWSGGPSAFTPDLSRWVQLGATAPQRILGIFGLYSGGLNGSFEPISPLALPIGDIAGDNISFSIVSISVHGSSADLATTVFQGIYARITYLPGDPSSTNVLEPGGDFNSYLAFLDEGEPTLELLARDMDDVVWGGRCGAHLGGTALVEGASTNQNGAAVNQGAISPDGSRIYFSTRPAQPFDSEEAKGPICDTDNPTRIMVRTATGAGPEIEPLLPEEPSEWEEPGEDLYEGASQDGGKVYLTTPRNLTPSDTDPGATRCSPHLSSQEKSGEGCDLYLYDLAKPEGERLTHVSDPEGPGPAEVLSTITAISKDGSHAYYVAEGVLTSDQNPEGDAAQAGKPNLYLFEADTGDTSFIATLADADKGTIWGAMGTYFGEAYAAGDTLAFTSKAPLTADDADGAHSDVFRYDASSETLERISKATEGGSDNGPFDVAVNPHSFPQVETNFNEISRWVSEDGEAIAFATAEALIPGDEDSARNPYVWSSGALGAAPAPIATIAPAISPQGDQIAFATKAPLLPLDGDNAEDVYVARQDGGFPLQLQAAACDPLQEGSCQGAGPALTSPAAPATTTFSGPGNAKEPTRCRKPRVKRRGKCVKPRKGKSRKAGKRGQGGKR